MNKSGLITALLCLALCLGMLTPAFAEEAQSAVPVFDNVREELSIAYAGEDRRGDKYELAFASVPDGGHVGYELYYDGKLVKDFKEEIPYVTLDSPSGEYKVVAYNIKDPAMRTESGPITVETERVTFFVRLRYFFSSLYLDTVIPGAAIWSALSDIPGMIAEFFSSLTL
jgi:hypothetical protein